MEDKALILTTYVYSKYTRLIFAWMVIHPTCYIFLKHWNLSINGVFF